MPDIPLKDAAHYFDGLSPRIARAAHQALVLAAMRGVQKIVAQIIPSRTPQPVDRGIFRAGWRVDDRSTAVFIENIEVHASFIEFGVRADNVKVGAAMIRALTEWVMRKGIAKDSKEATGIAWAIARSMQRRGIFNRDGRQGLGVLQELMRDHMPKIIQEEVAHAVKRELNG